MLERIGGIRLPVGRLHMELTNICNFSCEFCPNSKMKRPRGMMAPEMAKAIIDDVGRTGAARLLLFHVMGEPTLYPELTDIVRYATERQVETCLTTNGSLFDTGLLTGLIQAGLGKIVISLQTPDEKTFSLRGARAVRFDDYSERLVSIAQTFLSGRGKTKLEISFLSSPLRRLIIPIFPEVSIADTSYDLKQNLRVWLERICGNISLEQGRKDVLKQLRKSRSFKENRIEISDNLAFTTRILGDWSVHFDRPNVNAYFGYCPGVQENFGILWNGDYTFCCTDYDGSTSMCNFADTPLVDYLGNQAVQEVVAGFKRYRVLYPHCRQCLGDRNFLNAAVKQIGSIFYFKWIRRN